MFCGQYCESEPCKECERLIEEQLRIARQEAREQALKIAREIKSLPFSLRRVEDNTFELVKSTIGTGI